MSDADKIMDSMAMRKLISFGWRLTLMLLLTFASLESALAFQNSVCTLDSEATQASKSNSRETYKGQEYTKINLGELYQICINQKGGKILGHYVLRGIARRTAELDESGQFALVRTAVACCEAHAAPVGFRVNKFQQQEIEDGQWVKVFGVLEKLPSDLPGANLESVGLFFTRFNPTYGLIPSRIVKIPKPKKLYITEFRSKEPYAY